MPKRGGKFIHVYLADTCCPGVYGLSHHGQYCWCQKDDRERLPHAFSQIAIRILSSYLQVAGMLMSFKITLPGPVIDLVISTSCYAVVEQTLSFDCTAGSRRGLELFFMKQTVVVTLPLLLPLVACFWILANAWKRLRGKNSSNMSTTRLLLVLLCCTTLFSCDCDAYCHYICLHRVRRRWL